MVPRREKLAELRDGLQGTPGEEMLRGFWLRSTHTSLGVGGTEVASLPSRQSVSHWEEGCSGDLSPSLTLLCPGQPGRGEAGGTRMAPGPVRKPQR